MILLKLSSHLVFFLAFVVRHSLSVAVVVAKFAHQHMLIYFVQATLNYSSLIYRMKREKTAITTEEANCALATDETQWEYKASDPMIHQIEFLFGRIELETEPKMEGNKSTSLTQEQVPRLQSNCDARTVSFSDAYAGDDESPWPCVIDKEEDNMFPTCSCNVFEGPCAFSYLQRFFSISNRHPHRLRSLPCGNLQRSLNHFKRRLSMRKERTHRTGLKRVKVFTSNYKSYHDENLALQRKKYFRKEKFPRTITSHREAALYRQQPSLSDRFARRNSFEMTDCVQEEPSFEL